MPDRIFLFTNSYFSNNRRASLYFFFLTFLPINTAEHLLEGNVSYLSLKPQVLAQNECLLSSNEVVQERINIIYLLMYFIEHMFLYCCINSSHLLLNSTLTSKQSLGKGLLLMKWKLHYFKNWPL